MKTLKINLVAVIAVAIAVSTMSFKLVTNNSAVLQAGWYNVGAPQGGQHPIGELFSGGVLDGTCNQEFIGSICGVYWNGVGAKPATIEAMTSPELAYRDE